MKLYNFISIAADTIPRPDCKLSAQPCALAGCLAGGLLDSQCGCIPPGAVQGLGIQCVALEGF